MNEPAAGYKWWLKYTPEDGDLVQLLLCPGLPVRESVRPLDRLFFGDRVGTRRAGHRRADRNDGRMRLIVGCTLPRKRWRRSEGRRAAGAPSKRRSQYAAEADNPDENDALELLAWMVAKGHLDVSVAVPCDLKRQPIASNRIFHEKAGIIEDKTGDRLAWNGSLNETVYGWRENWESFNVFQSWEQDTRSCG